jgi:hypothetical protein
VVVGCGCSGEVGPVVEILTPHVVPRGLRVSGLGPANAAPVALNCGVADGARAVDLAATSRTGGRWWRSSGDGWVGDAEGGGAGPASVDTICRAVGLGRCIVVDAFSRDSSQRWQWVLFW